MDDNEEEYEDDAPAITLGDYLRPGESVSVAIREQPEAFTSQYADTEDEKDAFRVPAWFLESDYSFEDGDGEAIENGEECVLVSWSARLNRALGDAGIELAEDGEDASEALIGASVEIVKRGSGYEVSYDVDVIAEAAEIAE